MKYRAIIKKTGDWWVGWLVDLPGVNAQERTREALIESLIIGAEDMLALEVPFEPDGIMTTIDVPDQAERDDDMEQSRIRQTIEAGLKDSEAGRTIDVREVRERFGISE